MKEIKVITHNRVEFVDITSEVRDVVRASGVDSGWCIVYCPHTTGAITVNENADPSVPRDIIMELNKVVPFQDGYAHLEGNSAAHIKSSLIGASEIFLIDNGQLALGTWQGIFFCEFDGPRRRRIMVKISRDK